MVVEEVQERLRDGSLIAIPHACAEYRSRLAGEYSFLVGSLEQLKATKPMVWMEMRKNFKSDSATNHAYDSTEMGTKESSLQAQIKRVEKLMQGLNSLIKLAEGEAVNHY